MSNPDIPALALGAIATSSGTDIVTTALATAAVLGNIAGPYAELAGPMGERIQPTLNLVVAGADCPHWYQAQKLLLDPIESCQREFRERAAAVTHERLNYLESMRQNVDKTNELVESHEDELTYPYGRNAIAAWNRPFTVLRRPTFALRSPAPDIFEAAHPDILDGEAFLYYPDGGLTPTSKLASAIRGTDRAQASAGLGSIGLTHASMLATLAKEDLLMALSNDHFRILEECLLVPAPRAINREWPLEYAQRGYLAFNDAIRKTLVCRRKGGGPCIELNAGESQALLKFSRDLHGALSGLPEGMGRHFRHYPALPYKLMWAFRILGESREKCLPFIEFVVTEALTRHRDFLQTAKQATEHAERIRTRLVMLRKINEHPGKQRDLLRRYPAQRKELHVPVLLQLIADGLVIQLSDGLLNVSDSGKALLTGTRP